MTGKMNNIEIKKVNVNNIAFKGLSFTALTGIKMTAEFISADIKIPVTRNNWPVIAKLSWRYRADAKYQHQAFDKPMIRFENTPEATSAKKALLKGIRFNLECRDALRAWWKFNHQAKAQPETQPQEEASKKKQLPKIGYLSDKVPDRGSKLSAARKRAITLLKKAGVPTDLLNQITGEEIRSDGEWIYSRHDGIEKQEIHWF